MGQYLVVWERVWAPGDRDILAHRIKGDDGSLEGSLVAVNINSLDDTVNPAVAGSEGGDWHFIAEYNSDNPAVVSGPTGDFLTVFDTLPIPTNQRDIYGQLWGNRIYRL